jgi:crotonobetainyl-CoA:carnitine CoA-transferase CaiB-like acyl-CoA transferase
MYMIVSDVLPTRTSAQWVELFDQYDVPYGPVNTLEDLTEDGHLADVGFWHQVQHPTEGLLRVPSFPVRDGGPKGDASPATIAPGLGQHTVEVLTTLGYDNDAIDAMCQSGAVRKA